MDKKILIAVISVLILAAAAFLILKITFKTGANTAAVSALNMDNAGSLLDEAKRELGQGDEKSAVKTLQKLIAEHPDSPRAEEGYRLLGSTYGKTGNLVKARAAYQKAIEKFPDSGNMLKMQEALDDINVKILFSPVITPDSFLYEIQKGDTLAKIAKKYNTTVDLMIKANDLKDQTIRFGRSLKISKAVFSIVVDKSQNILTLKSDGEIFKTYNVSTGKNSTTPAGTFKITNKIINPVWYTAGAVVPPDSPNNILGSRWMGISREGYGIHGTTDPQSIGKSITAGCVRMKNSDVEELYSIIPEGTEVVIID